MLQLSFECVCVLQSSGSAEEAAVVVVSVRDTVRRAPVFGQSVYRAALREELYSGVQRAVVRVRGGGLYSGVQRDVVYINTLQQ